MDLPAETSSPKATLELGQALARRLQPGDVVALYGPLGAGKTQLVKGVGAALGIDPAEITSPTFVLLREHEGRTAEGMPLPLYHFDAYRLDGPDELFAIGAEDYLFGPGICLIEWADRVEALLPEGTLRLRMEHMSGDRRRISLIEDRE